MKGRITIDLKLSKEEELAYFGKYTEKRILEGKAAYWISVTPEMMGVATLVSVEVLEPLRDRKSKKEKKIGELVVKIQKERKKKHKARGQKIQLTKRINKENKLNANKNAEIDGDGTEGEI